MTFFKIKNSLRKKISFSIFAIIFIFGSFATYFVFYSSKILFLENETSGLVNLVLEQSHEARSVLKGADDLARKISEQDLVRNFFIKEKISQQDYSQVLDHLNSYNINNQYSSIYIMDMEGNTLVSTDESFVGNNYSFRDYFRKIILEGNESYLDVAVGVTSGELGYYISHSIKKNGLLLGVLVLKMKPNFVSDIIHLSDIDINFLSIIDEYGIVIFSNKEDLLYKSITNLSDAELVFLEKKKRYVGREIKPIGYAISYNDLSRTSSTKEFSFNDFEGDPSLLIITRIADYPLFMVLEKKEKAILVDAVNFSYKLAFAVSLSALMAFIVAYFAVRFITKPLSNINEAINKAAAGDLGQRVNIKAQDEFGEVGKNFNDLVSKFQNILKDIEKKVEERTSRLEDINEVMVGRELKMMELKKELLNYKNKENGKQN